MTNQIQYVNSKLPNNVGINIYDISAFDSLNNKLNELWTDIVIADNYTIDNSPWVMSYVQYQKDEDNYYLMWFFIRDNKNITNDVIVEQVTKFVNKDKQFVTVLALE